MAPGYRERRYTSQDNLSLYFRDYGDPASTACPVLYLSGLTRNSKDFADIAERLSSTRRVICPDYRGRGRSDYAPDWRSYNPRTYISDIMHLLTVTNIHRVVVVGTSLGGLLTMALSVAVPSMLAGAIVNDIGPDIEPGGLSGIVDYIRTNRPQDNWMEAEATLKKMFPDMSRHDDDTWARMARNTFREGDDGKLHFDWDVNIVRPILEGDGPPDDLWSLYGGLKHVPMLAIRGGLSPILSDACFDRMAAVKPDLQRLTVEGVGHTPHLNEPESRKAIDEFFARI